MIVKNQTKVYGKVKFFIRERPELKYLSKGRKRKQIQ